MKTSLKANLLKHFIAKKEEGGFTLIELLVVIIIIGILAAIALPSFLNQANKAKQSEAKTYVGSMNRAQQANYLEKGTFVSTGAVGRLGLGIQSSTTNYSYSFEASGDDPNSVINLAVPRSTNPGQLPSVKAYGGGVTIGTVGEGAGLDATTLAVLCEGVSSPIQGGVADAAAMQAAMSVEANEDPTCEDDTAMIPVQ